MCDDDGACVDEDGIRPRVVPMVVGIDHKSHWQRCECANRGKELASRFGPEIAIGITAKGGINDYDAIVANDESHIGTSGSLRFRIGNRRPDIRPDWLQRKRRLRCVLRAGRCGYAEKENTERHASFDVWLHALDFLKNQSRLFVEERDDT